MAEGEKPYRLYKGGRSKGKLPAASRGAPPPRSKGRGAKPVGHPLKHRTEKEFVHNDRNEEQDTTILERREALQCLLDQT